MSERAIDKMVRDLEIWEKRNPLATIRAKGEFAQILDDARRLALEEAKIKPTAPASLVGEIEKYVKWHGNPEGEGGEPTTFTCEYDEFFEILSRYRPSTQVDIVGELKELVVALKRPVRISSEEDAIEDKVVKDCALALEEIIRKHEGTK